MKILNTGEKESVSFLIMQCRKKGQELASVTWYLLSGAEGLTTGTHGSPWFPAANTASPFALAKPLH